MRCLNTVILQALNDSFIEVRKGCMVPAMAIYRFRTKLELINSESISYSVGRKKELIALLYEKQRSIIDSFSAEGVPSTPEEYRRHYAGFENMPFAFTDYFILLRGTIPVKYIAFFVICDIIHTIDHV